MQLMPAMPSDSCFSGDTLDALVRDTLHPQLDGFCRQLLAEGRSMTIDGTRVFNGRDKFLPGKIAMGLSYLLLGTPRQDERFAGYVEGFREIVRLTLDDANESWGIYYYVAALRRLAQGGLLDDAVEPACLATLREQLDWRSFVREADFTLIGLPTNYYGVAFSIARLRYLLGWEDAQASEILLRKTIEHYRAYSGEFGFSDETDGEGRFDRYSILLIGEICQRCIETGLELDAELAGWLRCSVDVILLRLNPEGHGFDFGRSIGAYGDTAFLEVLAAAARLNLLTPEERDLAHSFAVRATRKYVSFWFDAETQSVNLWDKGRRTDAYRGKHRILGENLSLLHQLLYTSRQWAAIGYGGTPALPDFAERLARLPRFSTTWFARGRHDRALITFRDRGHIISLPVINGGSSQHAHNPYFTIPFCNGLIQGAADAGWPQLLPRFTLRDGSVLIPAAFQRKLCCEQQGSALSVRYEQKEMDRLGADAPQADDRLSVRTRYTLDSGLLIREDHFTPTLPLDDVSIELEFASFSQVDRISGESVFYVDGAAQEFRIEGLPEYRVDDVSQDPLYQAPMGQLRSCVRCSAHQLRLDRPFSMRWILRYR